MRRQPSTKCPRINQPIKRVWSASPTLNLDDSGFSAFDIFHLVNIRDGDGEIRSANRLIVDLLKHCKWSRPIVPTTVPPSLHHRNFSRIQIVAPTHNFEFP